MLWIGQCGQTVPCLCASSIDQSGLFANSIYEKYISTTECKYNRVCNLTMIYKFT